MQIPVPRVAERVSAILEDPHAYFAQAVQRAWRSAEAEVAADLEARANHRRNHAEPRPIRPPSWLPATTNTDPVTGT